MNEELTSWWVDDIDSAYRDIKDFMVSNHTFLSRVVQFCGENTVAKKTQPDADM